MYVVNPANSRAVFRLVLTALVFFAASVQAFAQAPSTADSTAPPIELKPYKIRAFVTFDLSTRIDAKLRDVFIEDWLKIAQRFVGSAWRITPGDSDGPAGLIALDELTPAMARTHAAEVDKVWFIRGRVEGSSLILAGREFDSATGWLGSRHEFACPATDDVPRSLFRLSLAVFAPLAEIGESRAGSVMIRVQGGALPSPSPVGSVVSLGSIFTPVRVFLNPDGSPLEVFRVPYSYLRVEMIDGNAITCEIVRGVRDPLTRRVARKNKMIALGVKPAAAPTRLRFVQDADKQPASGYVVTARPYPTGPSREVGTTDREGRIVLAPGFAPGLVRLRLIAGKAEPMVDVPVMPGETPDERVIPFVPRPKTITLESRLDALKDSIIDVVAVRSRLERRMKSRLDSDTPDWEDVADSLKEYNTLPLRDTFVKKLESLEKEARASEKSLKTIIMTRGAMAQVADTRGLIDRYLDDDLFAAYADALNRANGKPPGKVQIKTATPKRSAPPVAAAPTKARPVPAAPAKGSGAVTPF